VRVRRRPLPIDARRSIDPTSNPACHRRDRAGVLGARVRCLRRRRQRGAEQGGLQEAGAGDLGQVRDRLPGFAEERDLEGSAGVTDRRAAPPEEYKDVHGKLAGTLRTLGERGDKVEQAAEDKDEAAIDAAVTSFQQGIQELDSVGSEFDKKVGTT